MTAVVADALRERYPRSPDAALDGYGNPARGGDPWIAQHAVLAAVVRPLLILAVFVPLSVHRFREMGR